MKASFVEVLYGSQARGNTDKLSDVDVLQVGDGDLPAPPLAEPHRLSVSRYSWEEFQHMRDNGSPFLVHLQTEGRVVGGNRAGISLYRSLMQYLPRYKHVTRDTDAFQLALIDAEDALLHQDSSPEFEAAAIATVVRHASILGCYLMDSPQFGRYEPTRKFCEARRLPGSIVDDFPHLYEHRIALARGYAWPRDTDYEYVRTWVRRAGLLVREVANVAA